MYSNKQYLFTTSCIYVIDLKFYTSCHFLPQEINDEMDLIKKSDVIFHFTYN